MNTLRFDLDNPDEAVLEEFDYRAVQQACDEFWKRPRLDDGQPRDFQRTARENQRAPVRRLFDSKKGEKLEAARADIVDGWVDEIVADQTESYSASASGPADVWDYFAGRPDDEEAEIANEIMRVEEMVAWSPGDEEFSE